MSTVLGGRFTKPWIPYLGRGLIIDAGGIAGLDKLVVQLQGADYPWHAKHQNALKNI